MNSSSKKLVEAAIKRLPQSILVSGPKGVGVSTIASYIALKLTKTPLLVLPEKDDKIDIENGVIKIERIRELYGQTKSIQTSSQVVVINHAEKMLAPAQNAFLKLLEEPGKNIHFILATHKPNTLLPTVLSRVSHLPIRPISLKQSEALINSINGVGATKAKQLMFIAQGLPAEIIRLAESDDYFEGRAEIMRDARDILNSNSYGRLKIANKYASDRPKTLLLLEYVSNILHRSLSAKPEKALLGRLDKLLQAEKQIAANGNIRLCLARFVL